MNTWGLWAVVAGTIVLSACAHTPDPTVESLRPSEVNADSNRYAGATVVVRGYLVLGPESHVLYESKQLNEEMQRRWKAGSDSFDPGDYQKYCLTIANPGLLLRNRASVRGKTLLIKGTIQADYLNQNIVDLGACPLPAAIIVDDDDLRRRYPSLIRKR
jgi:hypothetical protein